MTSERWQQVEDLFHQALDRPSEERTAFLEQAAGDDPELRHLVEQMLEADGQASMLFVAQAKGTRRLFDEAADTLFVEGRRIGPYRLLRVLGQGGMGTVYLAKREDLHNYVALKVVRGSLASTDVVQRFHQEQRALARLAHPHIARLLDAGVIDDTPYFVMEYVEGIPITDYCDKHHLSVEKRLELFTTVCDAVHFAHQNLVIHRDLKPSNILVTEPTTQIAHDLPADQPQPEAVGTVKLLDFGIAKLLDQAPPHPNQPVTRTNMRVMTPDYASPEQIEGKEVATTSDVYALGVLLYELLTGRRPYDLAGKAIWAMEQAVLFEEPDKPSTAATQANNTVSLVRNRRSITINRLRKRLQGDLDLICLKALRKEPERRYGSAEHLGQDVMSHLSGFPVTAQPDRMGYRLRKFVRRHRTAALTTTVVALVVTGLVAFYTMRLAQERDRATLEARKAEEIAAFSLSLFDVSDPFSSEPVRGDTLTARTILAHGRDRVYDELSNQPETKAVMLDHIGEVYLNLGQYDEAEPLFQEAWALRRETLGADHVELATSWTHLGKLHMKQGRYPEAESLFVRAVAMRKKAMGNQDARVAEALNMLGHAYANQGRFAEAERQHQEAYTISKATLGSEHVTTLTYLHSLALDIDGLGDMVEATRLTREMLTTLKTVMDPSHPKILMTKNNLASLLTDLEEYDEAEKLLNETLGTFRKILGRAHPQTLLTQSNLAILLRRKGEPESAEPLLREVIALRKDVLGPRHRLTLQSMGNLATLLTSMERFVEAEQFSRETLALQRDVLGRDHPDAISSLAVLAVAVVKQGRYAEAADYLRESLALDEQVFGPGHRFVAMDQSDLAFCLIHLGEYKEAETLLMTSRATFIETISPNNSQVRRVTDYLVKLYDAWDRPDDVLRWQSTLDSLTADMTPASP